MRWIRLWFLLASAYLAARLVWVYAISRRLDVDARLLAEVAIVPAIQTAALAPVVLWLNRSRRRSGS